MENLLERQCLVYGMNHRELFANVEGDQFPLLVKIIDACN